MHIHRLVLFIVIALCALSAHAQSGTNKAAKKQPPQTTASRLVPVTSPFKAVIGGREVYLPVPDGYVDRSHDAQFMAVMGAMLSAQLKTEGFFMHAIDAASGDMERPDLHPTYVLTSSKEFTDKDVTALQWETMRPRIRLQMQMMDTQRLINQRVTEGFKRASQVSGMRMQADMRFATPPEFSEAADGSLRMVATVPARITVSGRTASSTSEAGMWVGVVNKRLIIVYVYRAPQPNDAPNHAELRRLLDGVSAGLRQANP